MASQTKTLRFAAKCSPSQHSDYESWTEENPADDRGFPPELTRSRSDLFDEFTQTRAEDAR